MKIPTLLETETTACMEAFRACDGSAPHHYEVAEARWDCLKFAVQSVEREWRGSSEHLKELQAWFRQTTEPVLGQGRILQRARTWPEGYPGDYVTLELVYANEPNGEGLARILDRIFLSRTLAVAVRSRLRKLAQSLVVRATEETTTSNWLNLACGSCRELLSVPVREDRAIHCVDSDPNALNYARQLLSKRTNETLHFHTENAFRLVNPRRNIQRFGEFTTIYSAGLFDYLNDETLSRLLAGLYGSLAKGGVLIAPLKDATRYETFDYHWAAKWDFFFQRTEASFLRIFEVAGIPVADTTVKRDESGVILFFQARR